MAIWYDTGEPIRRIGPDLRGRIDYRSGTRHYLMRDESTKRVNVAVHPDARVEAVVEQSQEAEMIQAIDRPRLIRSLVLDNQRRRRIATHRPRIVAG
jgi:predicted metal-dependent RNase